MQDHRSPNAEHSVYALITALCRKIATESGFHENDGFETTVTKLRSKSFEILLLKSPRPETLPSNEQNTQVDALKELDAHLFATKLNAKFKGHDSTEFESQLNEILKNCESYFATESGCGVLRLLLALQQNLIEDEQCVPLKRPNELHVPGAFTLHGDFLNNRYFPQSKTIWFKNAEPKYFQSLKKLQATAKRGFITKSSFKSAENLLQEPKGKAFHYGKVLDQNPYDNEDCTFTGLTRRHICSDADWIRIDMRSLHLRLAKSVNFYKLQMSILSHKPIQNEDIEKPETVLKILPEKNSTAKVVEPDALIEPQWVHSWAWDQIGSKHKIKCAKPFISDVNLVMELQAIRCEERKEKFEAKILEYEQFMNDLKLLTVGLQSDTFQHDDLIIFGMLSDISVANVLPATIANYVEDFLECGTCYKRLQIMTMKRDYKLRFEGFIFKALCSAICEYLLTFRQFVFSKQTKETLISFYKRMQKPMRQVLNLSYTLAINPKVPTTTKFPMGSQFLGYIYREIMRTTDNDYITLLMFLLKRCCHVYFKYLQLWIFHGILDDPSHELFICFIDHYRNNTKYFYDKAYFVRKESVPGFFQNHEDRILQCGKYTMLLKAYKPNHPLFDLDCPKIAVRLSFDEIQKLEISCKKYAEKARELCGKPITVSDIFEARTKRRAEFRKMVYQRSRENAERWSAEQQLINNIIAQEKRKRFEESTALLEEVKQHRLEKRRQNVELELKALREAEKLDEERLERENINLRKRIEYYQDLSDSLRAEETSSTTSSRRTRRSSLSSSTDTAIEQTARTPTSGTQSCSTMSLDTYRGHHEDDNNDDDDDDTMSQYTECGSKAFEIEFAKTAQELYAFCEEREKAYANNNNFEEEKTQNNLAPPLSDGDMKVLHRSISDVINSNVPNEESSDTGISMHMQTSRHANRLKTMTGTIGYCLGGKEKGSNTQLEEPEILRVTFEDVESRKKAAGKPLTALEFNKQRVLATSGAFQNDFKDYSLRKSLPDINLNTLSDGTHNELERNRNRMMHGPQPFAEYNKSSLSARNINTIANEPLTDLERNRRKVLTEEYALHAQQKDDAHRKSLPDFKLSLLPEDMLSDMQRNRRRMMESPHPFSEYNKPALSARPKLNLALNTERARNRRKVLESEYNILTGDALSVQEVLTPMSTTSDHFSENDQKSDVMNSNLKLNISIVSKTTTDDLADDLESAMRPSTAATLPPMTPLNALNSAGVRARLRDGFEFILNSSSNGEPGNLNLTSDYDELDTTLSELNNTTPYERSAELLKSKFQCPPQSSVFRLNLNSNATAKKASLSSANSHNMKNFKIDSLSVITLTDFLQKSIIMPMNTHFEIVKSEVMRILLEDMHLIDHFRSLRNYFFLMDGEFGSIICDGIIRHVEEGEQPAKVLSYQMLHMVLDTALNCTIQKDRNAENLSFIVGNIPTKFELNSPGVLNVLSLSYSVEWPLNLILNPETLEQYGNIFKHLIKVRRVSWVLERAFELLRQAVKQHGKALLRSPQYLRIQQIRHKFYHFVHALQHHITATALQASWKLFKDELIHAKSLEDIYRMHTQYVKRILFLCMLNRSSAEFNNAIESIFKISLKFYNNLKSRDFKQRAGTGEYTHSRFNKIVSEEAEFEMLLRYTIRLGNKIVRCGYQTEIGEFLTLININNYYTAQEIPERASKPELLAKDPPATELN